MRRVSTLSIVLLALASLSCGGDSDSERDRTVATSPGPTGTTGPGSKSRQDGSPGRPDKRSRAPRNEADARFGEQLSFQEESFFGTRSQVVYFVASDGSQPLDQAKQCVERNLRKAPSAYCFAFPSERAFRYAGVSRRPPASMKRPCWTAYWGKPRNRRPLGSASNPAAANLDCPDAAG